MDNKNPNETGISLFGDDENSNLNSINNVDNNNDVIVGNGGGNRPKPGWQPARSSAVCHLGPCPGYNGETKDQTSIHWLTHCEGGKAEITQLVSTSNNTKSKMHAIASAVGLGRNGQFILGHIAGRAAYINIIPVTRQDGSTSLKVGDVVQLPPGMTAPELDGEPIFWTVRSNKPLPDFVPAWVKAKIEAAR